MRLGESGRFNQQFSPLCLESALQRGYTLSLSQLYKSLERQVIPCTELLLFLGVSLLHFREWHTTPVFLPGESHGQMSLVGDSPWGCKELDMTELHSQSPQVITSLHNQKFCLVVFTNWEDAVPQSPTHESHWK